MRPSAQLHKVVLDLPPGPALGGACSLFFIQGDWTPNECHLIRSGTKERVTTSQHSEPSGQSVTVTVNDRKTHTRAGNAYCSGLYRVSEREVTEDPDTDPVQCPKDQHAWGGSFLRVINSVQSWNLCGM